MIMMIYDGRMGMIQGASIQNLSSEAMMNLFDRDDKITWTTYHVDILQYIYHGASFCTGLYAWMFHRKSNEPTDLIGKIFLQFAAPVESSYTYNIVCISIYISDSPS